MAALIAAGCKPSGGGAGTGTDIPVGEFASLTGSEAAFGRASHNGTVLAIEQLNAAVVRILKDPQFKTKAEQQGFETDGTSSKDCDSFVQREINKWADAIKQAGIKPE